MGYYVADNMNTESVKALNMAIKQRKERNTIDSSFRQRIAILCE
jgi:hypothetical protein